MFRTTKVFSEGSATATLQNRCVSFVHGAARKPMGIYFVVASLACLFPKSAAAVLVAILIIRHLNRPATRKR